MSAIAPSGSEAVQAGDPDALKEVLPSGDEEHGKLQKKRKKHSDRDGSRERKRRSRDASGSDGDRARRRNAARTDRHTGGSSDHKDERGRDRRRSESRERRRERDRRDRSSSRRRKRSTSPARSRRHRSRSSSPLRHDRQSRSNRHRRSRSKSDDRKHKGDRRRSRSPAGHRDRTRDRSNSADKKASRKKKSPSPERTLPTLKEIITNNPGISVADAVQRLNVLNMQLQQAALMGGQLPDGTAVPLLPHGSAALALAGGASTKHQREIYVGNLPPGVSIPQITDYVNVAMRQLGVTPTAVVGSVVSAWVSGDGHYAFVELRTVEEANTAMAYLSGLQIGPFSLKVGRPKACGPSGMTVPMTAIPYTAFMLGLGPPPSGVPLLGGFPMPPITTTAAQLGGLANVFGSSIPGMAEGVSSNEPISNAVMTLNIPLSLTEHQIKELMSPFGPIKCFNMIADALGVAKSQTAVIEYETSQAADAAVSGLGGIALGESKLALQRVPQSMAIMLLRPANAVKKESIMQKDPLLALKPTAALQLSNMVTSTDLIDDELYAEVMEDVADECNSHGTVRSIVIPRPNDRIASSNDYSCEDKDAGVGKIFVLFVDIEGAAKARNAVNGRTFNGNVVEAMYYPEELLLQKVYKLPADFNSQNAMVLPEFSNQPLRIGAVCEPVD